MAFLEDDAVAAPATRVRDELGWSPRENLSSGLLRTIHWYLESRDWWIRVREGSNRTGGPGIPLRGGMKGIILAGGSGTRLYPITPWTTRKGRGVDAKALAFDASRTDGAIRPTTGRRIHSFGIRSDYPAVYAPERTQTGFDCCSPRFRADDV